MGQRLKRRELKQWAVPRVGLTLDELAESIRRSQAEAGLADPIVAMDYENNRILVNHVIQENE